MKAYAPLSAMLLLGLVHVAWAVPLKVQVLGPDKKPVPDAQVRLRLFSALGDSLQEAEPLAAQSDAKGLASFDVPEEDINGNGGFRGYATAWSPALALGVAVVKVGANNIKLDARGTSRGIVIDAAGKPVADALVRVISVDGIGDDIQYPVPSAFTKSDAAISEARTDAAGRWSISAAPLGGVVGVELADDKLARDAASSRAVDAQATFDWAPIEGAARAAAQASATSGATRRGRENLNQDGVLVARPAAAITGRVLDPNGAPVANVGVSANSSTNPYSYWSLSSKAAQTDATGAFRIERLGGGDYTVSPSLGDSNSKMEWVAGEPVKVKVAAGASAAAPDVKMIQGGTIEVRLLDEATGKGIKGARVYVAPAVGQLYSFTPSKPSDAEGRIVMRAAPGKKKVLMFGPPEDYLTPEHASDEDATIVEVKAGAPQNVLWKLKKGLAGAGRVLDEKGKPIANVSIGFRPTQRDMAYTEYSATSDESGRWKKGGFKPGAMKPYISGAQWKLVSPKEITFPLKGEQDFVVAPIGVVPISGRAVDGEGKPLAGVSLSLKINVVQDNMGTEVQRTATTAADGAWSVADVPDIAQSITIQATRVGYALDRSPTATKKDNAWSSSDAVLKLRNAHLSGQILRADGQPAPGAQVLVASTLAQVAADGAGRWKMSDLPSGEVEVVAVSGHEAAVGTTNAPNDAMSLKLRAPQVLGARDVDSAQVVVEDAWETSRGGQYSGRDALPAVLAASDPQAALVLAGGAEGKPSSGAILQIVRVLARKGDLDELQSWTQKNLESLSEPQNRQSALLLVSEALIGHDDEAAKKWLGLARVGFATLKDDWLRRSSATELAVQGVRLKEADAESWFEQALKLATNVNDGRGDLAGLAWAVAPVSEAWSEKVIQAALAATPKQPEYSEGPQASVGAAIQNMARTNLPGALRLLAKYGETKNKNGGDWQMSKARSEVMAGRARAGEDVDALLKEVAEGRSYMARTMAMVADNGPKARQIELLKRALEESQKQDQYSLSETLQVARRLIPLDKEAAKAALDRAREVLEAPRDENDQYYRLRASDVASWAWLYRGFDAAGARLVIEREWAIGQSLPSSDQDEWQRWPNMAQLVVALMPLDMQRAQQLAERLPVAGYNAPAFGAQRAIARWMMASAEERASKPLSFWSSDRDEDGRYSNEW